MLSTTRPSRVPSSCCAQSRQDAVHQADDGWQEGVESVSGQYVNIAINGTRFRMYVETAGQGVPVLLQHTAGCHGTQWRHLMQDRRITDRFQLIAYDLPFHGKSVPPTERQWWAEPYQLTGEFYERSLSRSAGYSDSTGLSLWDVQSAACWPLI